MDGVCSKHGGMLGQVLVDVIPKGRGGFARAGEGDGADDLMKLGANSMLSSSV